MIKLFLLCLLVGWWGKEKKKAEEGITQAGKMTSGEQSQYDRSFEIGQLLDQIYRGNMGLGQYPSGYQQPTEQFLQTGGELGQNLYSQTLAGVKDPYSTYESTLQPQLKLINDYINQKYQEKGLLNSGLQMEDMGRAGVELAISEADRRMQYRNQELNRGTSMMDYIQNQGKGNLASLSTLYGTQQDVAQGQRQMQAQYQAYPWQAQLGSIYGGEAAMQALPGQVIGAVGQAVGGIGGAVMQGASGVGGTVNQPMYQPIQKPTMSYPYR